MNILAIDQGTSSTKAVVIGQDETVRAVATEALTPTYFEPGGAEQDPQQLLDSVVRAGRRAVRSADVRVAAVALANQGETVLAWDPDTGEPLSDAVGWQDRRSTGICEALAEHADWVAQRTGLVLDPYFTAPKLVWLRQHITTEGVVTTTDSWLVHRLTGEFITDVATASRSLLLNLDTVTWDSELVELFGLGSERLPRLVDCDEIVGTTNLFGQKMQVVGLITDQPAALMGHGCLEARQAKCTFGTGAFLLANTGNRPVRSQTGLVSSVAWRLAGQTRYYLDAQAYTAASAVRWLHDVGLLADVTDLDRHAGGAAASDVYCVPAFAGLAAPWWSPDATATFAGVSLATTRNDLVAAVVRGLAAQVAELMDAVADDLGNPIPVLRADGGLSQSRVLMQDLANLSQTQVDVLEQPHATVSGAATLARLGLEETDISQLSGIDRPVLSSTPHWSADQANRYRARWRDLAAATLPWSTGRA